MCFNFFTTDMCLTNDYVIAIFFKEFFYNYVSKLSYPLKVFLTSLLKTFSCIFACEL